MRKIILALLVCLMAGASFAADYRSEALSEDIDWYDPAQKPLALYGVLPPSAEEPYFRRMPGEVARQVSPGVEKLYTNTAGGRISFYTDSPFVAVHARMWNCPTLNNLTRIGSAGYALYAGKTIARSVYSGHGVAAEGYEGDYDYIVYRLPEPQTITIYLPLYGGVRELLIGVQKGSLVKEAPAYKRRKPVVFYGSSITQGGCASHPGTSYQGILSRELDTDYINLGFSGNAKGEQAMADYIAGLDMSVFVLDYDHNAPSPEHLEATHHAFYKTVRAKNPDLPIIMISRPKPNLDAEERQRLRIIRESFRKAVADGDRNVYFIDGSRLMKGYSADAWSVDRSHPNDYGFILMAKGIGKVLKPLLK